MAADKDEMTPDEIQGAEGEALPDRKAMTILPVGADPGQFFTLPVEPPDAATDGAPTEPETA